MKLFLIADLHVNPLITWERQEHIEKLLDKAEDAERYGWQVALLGDTVDELEFGNTPHAFCLKVTDWANSRLRLEGNHDPGTGPRHIVVGNWYLSHLHEFDTLWSWLPLKRVWLPSWLVKWYRTPAQKKTHNLRDWHTSTAIVEFNAAMFAIKKGYKGIAGGHTHSPVKIEREGYTLLNVGDGVDSFTYALLDTETGEHSLVGF